MTTSAPSRTLAYISFCIGAICDGDHRLNSGVTDGGRGALRPLCQAKCKKLAPSEIS